MYNNTKPMINQNQIQNQNQKQCFNEKIIDNLMKKTNHNFDCVNISLEFAGYKYRNGKYIKVEVRSLILQLILVQLIHMLSIKHLLNLQYLLILLNAILKFLLFLILLIHQMILVGVARCHYED